MSGRLEDKVVIITGRTSGIGRRTVEIFAEEGAFVLIAARREDDGRKRANRLGDKVNFLKTDVSFGQPLGLQNRKIHGPVVGYQHDKEH